MPIVRVASAADAVDLARLAEQTFRATFAATNTVDDMNHHCELNYGAEIQRREILNPDIVTLLVSDANVIIAYAQLCLDTTPDCLAAAKFPGEIRRLYVLEAFHGRGIAQRLMNAALDQISQRGSDVAWLGVWEHNPRAIAFYEKFGFRPVGEHRFRLGQDLQRDLIMSKLVNTTR